MSPKDINTSIRYINTRHYRINMHRLIKQVGGFKLTEGGYIYDKQRVCGKLSLISTNFTLQEC